MLRAGATPKARGAGGRSLERTQASSWWKSLRWKWLRGTVGGQGTDTPHLGAADNGTGVSTPRRRKGAQQEKGILQGSRCLHRRKSSLWAHLSPEALSQTARCSWGVKPLCSSRDQGSASPLPGGLAPSHLPPGHQLGRAGSRGAGPLVASGWGGARGAPQAQSQGRWLKTSAVPPLLSLPVFVILRENNLNRLLSNAERSEQVTHSRSCLGFGLWWLSRRSS